MSHECTRGGWTRVMFHHSVMWLPQWSKLTGSSSYWSFSPHTRVIQQNGCIQLNIAIHIPLVTLKIVRQMCTTNLLLYTLSSCYKPANTVDHMIFLCWDHWSRSHVIQKSYNEKHSVINYFNENTTHHKEIELYNNWQYDFAAILLKQSHEIFKQPFGLTEKR